MKITIVIFCTLATLCVAHESRFPRQEDYIGLEIIQVRKYHQRTVDQYEKVMLGIEAYFRSEVDLMTDRLQKENSPHGFDLPQCMLTLGTLPAVLESMKNEILQKGFAITIETSSLVSNRPQIEQSLDGAQDHAIQTLLNAYDYEGELTPVEEYAYNLIKSTITETNTCIDSRSG